LRFEVINVSTGTAEVEFAGKGAQKLVYTPSSPDGSTAKVNYRVTDSNGDVSTALATIAITTTGALPTGLESAEVGDANGEAIETRCLKVAKGGATTTTATIDDVEASDDVAAGDVIVEGNFDEPSGGSNKSPRTTNVRGGGGGGGGDDTPRAPRDDSGGGSEQPQTPQTTRPPTTQTTQPQGPTTTRCDSKCWQDRVNEDDPPEG
jgi:hypothetical protein